MTHTEIKTVTPRFAEIFRDYETRLLDIGLELFMLTDALEKNPRKAEAAFADAITEQHRLWFLVDAARAAAKKAAADLAQHEVPQ